MRSIVLVTLLAAALPLTAAAADCARAVTPVEKMICADPEAMRLDTLQDAAYQQALDKTAGAPALKRWQRNWLKSPAVKACRDGACLRAELTAHTALLQAVASPDKPAGRYTGYYVRHDGLYVDRNYADLLLIGLEDGRVLVTGSAIWLGPKADEGQVNTGAINSFASMDDKALRLEQGQCKLTMHADGRGLAVSDNGQCGGNRVTFNGSYHTMLKP